MMDITKLLTSAVQKNASDVFIVAGRPLSFKCSGQLTLQQDQRLLPADTENLIRGIYHLAEDRSLDRILGNGDDDFSFAIKGVSRFRVSAYKQRGSLAAVVRIISFHLPKPSDLGIPDELIRLTDVGKGLILVTGPAGSGKSTTQACMIDYINQTKGYHIITLEDPLEFLHSHKKSIVSQREINTDTESYVTALRASLRQSPDVILLGEMRDYETIQIAMTAAETGHLVISTLHTLGAANTIDRIIDVFPANQQQQIAIQLSTVLKAVVSQQLVPTIDGKQVPAFEIMTMNQAIRNQILEHKFNQIKADFRHSMDDSLFTLVKAGKIDRETALAVAANREMLEKKLPRG